MADVTTENSAPSRAEVAKDEAVDQVQDLAATATEHAAAMRDEAKGQALNVARDVRREFERQGDAQAQRASSTLREVGSQLHDMADRGQPGAVTEVTRQLGDRSHQLASRLDHGGLQGVGDDVRGFAGRRPGVFLAAAGVAGFVVARVLRNAAGDGASGIQSPATQVATPAPATHAGASGTGTPARGALP